MRRVLNPGRVCAWLLFGLLFGQLGALPTEARDVTDATGVRVGVPDRPTRIVTLAPSLAELVASLLPDARDRLVGVSSFSDEPSFVKLLEDVGPYSRVNLERVLALRPDLVLATQDGNSRDQVQRLREAGLPVVVVSGQDLAAVADSMRRLGLALGQAEAGQRMASRFEAELEAFKRRSAARGRPRVMLQIGDDPLVVAGGSGFLQEVLALAGGNNVFSDLKAAYPRPSLEEVRSRDPEVIAVVAMTGDRLLFERMAERWRSQAGLKAARLGRVRIVPGDRLLRPTPRLLEGLRSLEEALHAN